MYNGAFQKNYTPSKLKGTDPLVRKIARKEGVSRFDHGKPADWLLRHRDEILPSLSDETQKNFEKLFSCINATLSR